MTGREKREREAFYKTIMLSLSEVDGESVLLDVLPMAAEAGSQPETLVRGMLMGETDKMVSEEEADRMYLGYADKKEAESLYKATEDAQTDAEWTQAMQALGWFCQDALSPILSESLL